MISLCRPISSNCITPLSNEELLTIVEERRTKKQYKFPCVTADFVTTVHQDKVLSSLTRWNTQQVYYHSIRSLMEDCYGRRQFEEKIEEEQLKMYAVSCHMQSLMLRPGPEPIKYDKYEQLQEACQHCEERDLFDNLDEDEQNRLLSFRNAIAYALKVVHIEGCKGILFDIATKMEGRNEKWVNGGGAKPEVRRRYYIVELESGLKTKRRIRTKISPTVAADDTSADGNSYDNNHISKKRKHERRRNAKKSIPYDLEDLTFQLKTNSGPEQVKDCIISLLKQNKLLNPSVNFDYFWDKIYDPSSSGSNSLDHGSESATGFPVNSDFFPANLKYNGGNEVPESNMKVPDLSSQFGSNTSFGCFANLPSFSSDSEGFLQTLDRLSFPNSNNESQPVEIPVDEQNAKLNIIPGSDSWPPSMKR